MKVWSCSLIESSTSQKHLEKNASWCQLSRKVVLGCAGAYLSNISKDPLLPWSKRPPGGHQVNPAPIVITVIAIAFRPAKRDERFRWTGWTYENHWKSWNTQDTTNIKSQETCRGLICRTAAFSQCFPSYFMQSALRVCRVLYSCSNWCVE